MSEQEGPAQGQGPRVRSERPATARLRTSTAIRVLGAVSLAAALTAGAILLANTPEPPTTDVVGYPIFRNFNVENYFFAYYAVIGFFPIAAILIFLGLTRMGPRIGLAVPPPRGNLRPAGATVQEELLEPQPPLPDAPPVFRWTIRAGRTAFVGAVLGLEVGVVTEQVWAGLTLGAAAYALVTALLAAAWSRWAHDGRSLGARLAAVNAVAAPAAVAGLVAVSSRTAVTIVSDGSVHSYPWFPVWLGLPIGIALMGWVALRVGSATSEDRVLAIERNALLFLTAPVGLFLLLASLPGDPGPLEMFESGQGLVGAKLVGDGWLPWRDVLVAHGIFLDAVQPAIGFGVFEHSQWGRLAGYNLLTGPFYLITTFLLFAYLFRRNVPFLLLTGLVLVGTTFVGADVRFILWPPMLLLLALVLSRPSRLGSLVLAFMVVGQAIVTPEAAPMVLAVTAVVVLYEWYWREPGTQITSSFQRTLWFAGAGVVFAGAFAIYMASRGGLDDFIYLTNGLVKGHVESGGIPPTPIAETDLRYGFRAIAPLAALLISFAYVVARLRLRRPFLTEDWVMAAVALFLGPYYLKYLAFMDSPHLGQVFGIAIPLMLFIVYRAVMFVEQWIRGRTHNPTLRATHPLTLVLALTVAVIVWGPVEDHVSNAESNFRPSVAVPAVSERVGYSKAPYDRVMFRDLKRVIDSYLGPKDRLFDFTNAPTLYYYLMNRDPSTRYLVVLVAHSESLQEDLIDELRKSPPKLIVFDSASAGLPNWSGIPNMVRHYDVSRWILDHYRPLLATHSTTIYARRDMPSPSQVGLNLAEKPITRGVPFRSQSCTWGYIPNFLDRARNPNTSSKPVSARLVGLPRQQFTISGWAGDVRAEAPAREIVVTIDGKVAARFAPRLDRPDLLLGGLPPGYQRSGYRISIAVPRHPAPYDLRVFGIASDGSATELPYRSAPQTEGSLRLGTRAAPIDPVAIQGAVDEVTKSGAVELELPRGSRWNDYAWLQLDAGRRGFQDGSFVLYDRPNRPSQGREISFQTLDDSPTRYTVPVASCPQWHGYRGHRLFLASGPAQDIAGVKLIR